MNSWTGCVQKKLINMFIAVFAYINNLNTILLLDGPELQSTNIMKIVFKKIYYAQYNKKHYDRMIKNKVKNIYYGNIADIIHKNYDIIYLDLTCTPWGNANFDPLKLLLKIKKNTHIFITFSLRSNRKRKTKDHIIRIISFKKYFNIKYYYNETLHELNNNIKTYKRNMTLLYMQKK